MRRRHLHQSSNISNNTACYTQKIVFTEKTFQTIQENCFHEKHLKLYSMLAIHGKLLFQFVATLFTMASWYMLIGIYRNFFMAKWLLSLV